MRLYGVINYKTIVLIIEQRSISFVPQKNFPSANVKHREVVLHDCERGSKRVDILCQQNILTTEDTLLTAVGSDVW